MPSFEPADYRAVFEYFGVDARDWPAESGYPYAPVFRARVAGVPAAVKRARRSPVAAAAIARWVRVLAASGIPVVTPIQTGVPNPGLIGDQMWVAYPWIDGRAYDGSAADIAAAGELLGRMHARTSYVDAAIPRFKWPQHDQASVQQDIEDLTRVLESRAPAIARHAVGRTAPWHRTFMAQTLTAIRETALPFVIGSTDFRASNLVYNPTGPVLVDPDNADYLPRILDLAIAALLFHSEMKTAPPRLFTRSEWEAFAQAYSAHAKLTGEEVELWQTALQYVICEWGTWTLVAADESGDWADPHNHAFLLDLAIADPAWFQLSVT
jgi:Ser/Thr protein kinase RdoA (MazF antagonist)